MQAYRQNSESKWKATHQSIMQCRDSNDRDGPAGFTVVELRKYIQNVLKKNNVGDDEVKKMFVDLDADHKNYVSQGVFIKEMSKLPRKQAFQTAFDMRDYNRDGWLTKDEISAAFDMVGVEEEDAMKFFKQVDTNSDGKISRCEFLKMV